MHAFPNDSIDYPTGIHPSGKDIIALHQMDLTCFSPSFYFYHSFAIGVKNAYPSVFSPGTHESGIPAVMIHPGRCMPGIRERFGPNEPVILQTYRE
jgi:hypothetical protein